MKDFIKGWGRVCLGSVAAAGLGAASFFAVEALMPEAANAQVYGFEVTKYGFADQTIKVTKYGFADKTVKVRGRCSDRYGLTKIKLTKYGFADETWKLTKYGFADMDICLAGDIDEWFEYAE